MRPDHEFEAQLVELLERRAERVEVKERRPPDDVGPTPTGSGAPPLRRFLPAAAALLVVLAGAAAALTAGGASAGGSGEATLAAVLRPLEAPVVMAADTPDVIVWLEPDATDAQIAAIEDALAVALASGELDRVHYVNRSASWTEFVEYYADQPVVVEAVDAEQLPTRFEVTLADPGGGGIEELEALAGVRRVTEALAPSG